MNLINPFKPTVGMAPPILMGREAVLEDFSDGLLEGPGSPGRLMRITGPRGSGKTVLLTELGELAAARGWRVIHVVSDEDSCVQLMIRERQNIAFVFAGTTTGVLDLLNNKSMTFLRRAKSEELANIPIDEVPDALRTSIERSGLRIAAEALETAAVATEGYAYLTQLVGYNIWRTARRHVDVSREITMEDVERGVRTADKEYADAVLETALADLTRPAIEYLLAMCEDEAASSTGDIAKRMERRTSDANTYRRILIARQIIEATATGYVAFSMPRMRQYLMEHRERILARYGG